MKKVHLFLLLITVGVFSMMSCQDDKNELFDEMDNLANNTEASLSEDGTAKRSCGHTHHMQGLLENPEYKRAHEEKLEKIATMAQSRMACSSPVILPMAVHFQGVSNPNATCLKQLAQSQVAILNADYSGTNGDISQWTNNASSSFPGVNNGETCIQFCLATKNHPSGYGLNDGDIAVTINKTTGDDVADWSGYINIYVRANLGYLGYSPLGGSGNGDGVTIDANAFGSGAGCGSIKPNNPYDLGRTLTHELGHYLLLDHVWGDNGGCNQDDGVADTPNCSQANYGCPSIGISSCNSKDLHMNYMDYTNDACMYMFTAGQSTRMENYVASSLQNVVSKAASVCGISNGGGDTGGNGDGDNGDTGNGGNGGNGDGGNNDDTPSTQQIKIKVKPDNYGSEIFWELLDENEEVVAEGGPYADGNTTVKTKKVTIDNNACYTFVIYDDYGDGICCDYGSGWWRIKDENNQNIVTSNGRYGFYQEKSFCLDQARLGRTSEKEDDKQALTFDINKTTISNGVVQTTITRNAKRTATGLTYKVLNEAGQIVYTQKMTNKANDQLNIQHLPKGVYFVQINDGQKTPKQRIELE